MGEAGDGEREWRLESIFHFVVNVTNFERSLAFSTTRTFGMPAAYGRGALLVPELAPTGVAP